LMDSWSIDKDDLTLRPGYDAFDREAGGLRLIRYSGDLFSDKFIQQSRLAGVWSSN